VKFNDWLKWSLDDILARVSALRDAGFWPRKRDMIEHLIKHLDDEGTRDALNKFFDKSSD
jgi:hypothetical protein